MLNGDAQPECRAHWPVFYMTGGTVMPMTARQRINSRRTTATVASRNCFPLLVRFAQDGMAMVERIEKLPQLENMFRQKCRLRGRNALLDHRGRLGRRQPEFPDLVRSLAGESLSQIGGRDLASSVSARKSRDRRQLCGRCWWHARPHIARRVRSRLRS